PASDATRPRVRGVYESGGARRTLQQTLHAMLEALCGDSPDFEAWAALEATAREEQGEKADAMLASWVTRRMSGRPEEQRGQVAAGGAAGGGVGRRGAPPPPPAGP